MLDCTHELRDTHKHMNKQSPIPQTPSHGISVEVKSLYVPEQSNPSQPYFFFSYTVKITNQGPTAAKLISRHWLITDGLGRTSEVKGEGVVGQQPRLEPGESFEYTSFCPLPTPTGTMKGSYHLVDAAGAQFEAQIPEFFLIEPSSYN